MGSMAFIGDDRPLVIGQMGGRSRGHVVEGVPNLIPMDTSTLTDSLAVPLEVRFVCNPRYRGMHVKVMAEEAAYLLFYLWGDPSGRVQGIFLVRSETLLRLARERGGGTVEWDTWGKFTVALDTNEVPGADSHTKYWVSGSKLTRTRPRCG